MVYGIYPHGCMGAMQQSLWFRTVTEFAWGGKMTSSNRKRCGFAATMAVAISLTSSPTLGNEADAPGLPTVSASEAALRVNVAGRQRMLSQRMAKAACLMATDVAADVHFDQMDAAYALFVRSNEALRAGDPDIGLQPERYRRVLNALDKMDLAWSIYSKLVEQGIETKQFEVRELKTINSESVEVLTLMNRAVNTTARAYGSVTPNVPLTLTITVDVAGRQRMLTQKAVKEACLMRVSDTPEVFAEALKGTVGMFDLSLTALRFGMQDVGVMSAPTGAVADKLAEVQELWAPVKSLLDQAATGDALTESEIRQLAQMSEPLLKTMNQAVGLYESAGS